VPRSALPPIDLATQGGTKEVEIPHFNVTGKALRLKGYEVKIDPSRCVVGGFQTPDTPGATDLLSRTAYVCLSVPKPVQIDPGKASQVQPDAGREQKPRVSNYQDV